MTWLIIFIGICVILIVYKLYREDVKRVWSFTHVTDYGINRRLMELSFQLSVYAVIVVDLYGRILLWNESAQRKFGYSQEEMIGKDIKRIIPERYHEAVETELRKWRETGTSEYIGLNDGIEIKGLNKAGREFPVHLKTIEINDNGFKTIGAFVRNIEKEKAKEKLLIDELKLLRKGELIAEIGTWSWDLLTRKVIVSSNFYKIFNCDEDEEVTSDMLMDLIYPDDKIKTASAITTAIENKENYRVTYRRLQKDGSLHWLEVKGHLVLNENSDIFLIEGTIQKIDHGLE